ncbi:MAG: hypothetical protein ACFFCZ_07280 [Promethearchaeota archaeon]
MANIPILAMLFGIIGTSQLHLAKAMERQGIEIFDQIKAKLKLSEGEDKDIAGGIKKPVIYTVGMALNQTVFVWQMFGASFGLASHYTSMFGLGLIVLMIYSSKILKEKITRTEYVGAAILITGTLILGFENMNQQSFDRSNVNAMAAVFFLIIFLLIGVTITRFTLKKNIPLITGILFGLFSGGLGCLDQVFKELGVIYGRGLGELPIHPFGWVLYLSSFGIGFLALLFTQWGFARKANASVLVPVYNTMYITLPIFLQIITFPGYFPNWATLFGILITITGIMLMQIFKKDDFRFHSVNTTEINDFV